MKILIAVSLIFLSSTVYGQKPRARDLGVPFAGTTGPLNAITVVKGVEVGYSTIISGKGKNIVGKGPGKNRGYSNIPQGQG